MWTGFLPWLRCAATSALYGWQAWACQQDPDWTIIRSLKRVLQDAGPNTILELADQQVPLIQVLREMAAALRDLLPQEKLEVMLGVPAERQHQPALSHGGGIPLRRMRRDRAVERAVRREHRIRPQEQNQRRDSGVRLGRRNLRRVAGGSRRENASPARHRRHRHFGRRRFRRDPGGAGHHQRRAQRRFRRPSTFACSKSAAFARKR